MENRTINLTITTYPKEYATISANFDEEKKCYYMPSLKFKEIEEIWDNPVYFQKIMDFLQRYLNKKIGGNDFEEFEQIWKLLSDDFCICVIFILQKAKELGWFKL